MRVVIVDDHKCSAGAIAQITQRFLVERDLDGHIAIYNSGVEFLRNYHGDVDLILLDILMPGLRAAPPAHAGAAD